MKISSTYPGKLQPGLTTTMFYSLLIMRVKANGACVKMHVIPLPLYKQASRVKKFLNNVEPENFLALFHSSCISGQLEVIKVTSASGGFS